jgi:hypothetical protein
MVELTTMSREKMGLRLIIEINLYFFNVIYKKTKINFKLVHLLQHKIM